MTQTLPLRVCLDIWLRAISESLSREWTEKNFEVCDNRKLVMFEVIEG
jgi:hypothetical protein